jgi:hypothetical protein
MQTRLALLLGLFTVAGLFASSTVTAAAPHARGQSYVYFRIYDDSVQVRVEITMNDLNEALNLNMPHRQGASTSAVRGAIATHLDSIRAYVERNLQIATAKGPVSLRFRNQELLRVGATGDFVLLNYDVEGLTKPPDAFDVRYTAMFDTDSEHRNMVIVEHNWKTSTFNNEGNVAFILRPGAPQGTLDLTSSSVWRGLLGMVRFGITHILVGTDHILFLLALILPSVLRREDGRWKAVPSFRSAGFNILAIVTFFTVAHSVTLSLAALNIVRLPSILVESVIAASIAAAALHNLYPRFIKHESIIAFVFGLFHGFGFASLLEPLGLGGEYTTLTLLGFNVGVEIGQVAVIALLFPILFLLRKRSWYTRTVLQVGSVLLIAIALFWFVERAFDPPLIADSKAYVKDLIRPVYYAVLGR